MAPQSALHDIRRSIGANADDPPERRRTLRERYLDERAAILGWARDSGCLLDGRDYYRKAGHHSIRVYRV